MTNRSTLLLLALALLSFVQPATAITEAWRLRYSAQQRQARKNTGRATTTTTETRWFEQRTDHFSPDNNATFSQRYYVNRDHYDSSGPCHVFVYIGGEAVLYPGSIERGEIVEVGLKYAPLFVALEHRFYGASHPFEDLRTDNLAVLTTEQALDDIAAFVVGFAADEGLPSECKVFTFGGSYPGNLAAWFRLKFPHLTEGSVASSAPVVARDAFYEYDQFVAAGLESFDPQCAVAVRAAGNYVAGIFASGDEAAGLAVKRAVGCDPDEYLMPDTDFLWVISDAVAAAVQYDSNYGGIARLCGDFLNNVTGAPVVEAKLVQSWVSFTAWVFATFGSECKSFTSTRNVLTDTTITETGNLRQWMWQSCTQFGYFQIAPTEGFSVRPLELDLAYNLELCDAAFGDGFRPDIEGTNARYGGLGLAGTRIYLPNGSVDPWTALGVVNSTANPFIVAEVIEGTSHCADLAASSSSDPPSLTAARASIAAKVEEWLR